MTPNSPASSHSATASGRIERSVFTDCAESSSACANLPWVPRLNSRRTAGQSRLPPRNRSATITNPFRAGCSR